MKYLRSSQNFQGHGWWPPRRHRIDETNRLVDAVNDSDDGERALRDFLVVLDGDARHRAAGIREIASRFGHSMQPLFLPGEGPPERLLAGRVRQRDRVKAALRALGDRLNRSTTELARTVARQEAAAGRSPMPRFQIELREQIETWRRR